MTKLLTWLSRRQRSGVMAIREGLLPEGLQSSGERAQNCTKPMGGNALPNSVANAFFGLLLSAPSIASVALAPDAARKIARTAAPTAALIFM